jgi:methylase of polypeptide subunit release factors
MSVTESALVEVGRWLRERDYQFVTVTPETHRRVNARAGADAATTLRDVFGWSRPFDEALLPAEILAALRRAEAVVERDGRLAATVRFSSLAGGLYVHSAYPTRDEASVFFGPDTYRFCALLAREVGRALRVVDVGCGSGAGGLMLASRAREIVLADINPNATRFARVNAELAGAANRVEVVQGDLFAPVTGAFDLAIANPPYLVDAEQRTYRDGGGDLGTGLAVRIVREALERLSPGGRLILYTGAPIVAGEDRVRSAVEPLLDARGARWTYAELDPDVFGEELDTPAYAAVDRIAAIALVASCA